MKITSVNLVHFVVPAYLCLIFFKGTNLIRAAAVEIWMGESLCKLWARSLAPSLTGREPKSHGASFDRLRTGSAESIEKKGETLKYLLQ